MAQENFNITKLGALFKKEMKVKNVPNPTKYEILYNYFGLAGVKLDIHEEKTKNKEESDKELYKKARQRLYQNKNLVAGDQYEYLEKIISTLKNPNDKRSLEQKKELRKLIEKLSFFNQSAYKNLDLDEITNIMQYVCLEPGATIFKQGDKADGYYIVLKGCVAVQIPDPEQKTLTLPEDPKQEVQLKKEPTVQINKLKTMIMENKDTLSKNELNELTPIEIKKYKTRTMLNEILNSKNVIRSSTSPWDRMKQSSYIKDFVKLDGHKTIEENNFEEESDGVTSV